jgi:hypothetical protein
MSEAPICEECDTEMHRYWGAPDTGRNGWACCRCGWTEDDDPAPANSPPPPPSPGAEAMSKEWANSFEIIGSNVVVGKPPEKEIGQMAYEKSRPNWLWCEIPADERKMWASIETAIRADERANLRAPAEREREIMEALSFYSCTCPPDMCWHGRFEDAASPRCGRVAQCALAGSPVPTTPAP